MKERERIERLDDDFVEAILAMTPEEAIYGITAEDLASMRSRVSTAAGKIGRAKLAQARIAANADARRPKPHGSAQGAKALNDIRANDATFNQRLTLAARNGGADYEEDRASIEADLEELRQDEERGDRD